MNKVLMRVKSSGYSFCAL